MNVLDWLKRLFARMAPVETAKGEKPMYEIHCHQCDNVFMSSGILLDGGCNFSLLMLTRVCPKCGGKRTSPFEADKSFYQRIWDMEEVSSYISQLSRNWSLVGSPVDKGKREFKCTQCGSTFSALDIKPHPYSASFPSRCPHCQSIRTLPASDEDRINHYESIWLIMERAEKEREERKNGKKNVDLKKVFGDSLGWEGIGF